MDDTSPHDASSTAANGPLEAFESPTREADFAALRAAAIGVGKLDRHVVLTGEIGLGKTTLLDRLAAWATADGYRSLRAQGHPSEVSLPFGTLHQLVAPLLTSGEYASHAAGILSAMSTPAVDHGLDVSTSWLVLELLRRASERAPLLLIIDDTDVADEASRRSLEFIANRLNEAEVTLVLAFNGDLPDHLRRSRVVEIVVRPLNASEATQLIENEFPRTARMVKERIVELAGGNPLALREYASALSDAELEGRAVMPVRLPLPPRLASHYRPTVEHLSPVLRSQLIEMGLDLGPSGWEPSSSISWRPQGAELDVLRETGMLRVDAERRVRFTSATTRNALLSLVHPEEILAAHRALAQKHNDDPLRSTLHRAVGGSAPDATLARDLNDIAPILRARGQTWLSIAALVRASDLAETDASRAALLTRAAEFALEAGYEDLARSLFVRSEQTETHADVDPLDRAVAQGALHMRASGDADAGLRSITTALAAGPCDSDETVNRALQMLLMIGRLRDDDETWNVIRGFVNTHRERLTVLTELLADTSVPGMWPSAVEVAHPLGPYLERFPRRLTPEESVHFGVSAYYIDQLADVRVLLQDAFKETARHGTFSRHAGITHLVAIHAFQSGAWDTADDIATGAMREARRSGLGTITNHLRGTLGLLAAARGDVEAARHASLDMEAWALPRRLNYHRQMAFEVRLLAAVSAGDFEAAAGHAMELLTDGQLPPWPHYASRTVLDVVEALTRSGRRPEALHVAQSFSPAMSGRARILSAAACALVAEPDDSAMLFRSALNDARIADWPFEQARILLLNGEWLRRHHRAAEARHTLTRARDLFDMLGAVPWTRRAAAELRATGVLDSEADLERSADMALTAQEYEVAALAASGLTNKAIAQRLYISPRTVSGHLYRIFPKLGVSTRAQLRDALGRETSQSTR